MFEFNISVYNKQTNNFISYIRRYYQYASWNILSWFLMIMLVFILTAYYFPIIIISHFLFYFIILETIRV